MFDFGVPASFPHAHVDPITSAIDALLVILRTVKQPAGFDTVVLTLDAAQCGHGFFTVTGTHDPDALFGVLDMVCDAAEASPVVDALIVASIRPNGGVDPSDLERWHEADERCAQAAVDLTEWFVIGETIQCPRALCGVDARWAS